MRARLARINVTALVALLGLLLLTCGVWAAGGWPVAAIILGLLLLTGAVADALLDMRGR